MAEEAAKESLKAAQEMPDPEASLIEEALKQEIAIDEALIANEDISPEVDHRPAGQQWPVCTP